MDELKALRERIDQADRALLQALAERFRAVEEIGHVKLARGLPLEQQARWEELMKQRLEAAAALGLPAAFTESLYELIHQEALRIQRGLVRKETT